mmetsp:Transcript_7743/g.16567  ORF Transcript_7743/g.16567 Transcript_7743/m.16567 type:complete len:113 (-) Transcript_7743:625-963(-)
MMSLSLVRFWLKRVKAAQKKHWLSTASLVRELLEEPRLLLDPLGSGFLRRKWLELVEPMQPRDNLERRLYTASVRRLHGVHMPRFSQVKKKKRNRKNKHDMRRGFAKIIDDS